MELIDSTKPTRTPTRLPIGKLLLIGSEVMALAPFVLLIVGWLTVSAPKGGFLVGLLFLPCASFPLYLASCASARANSSSWGVLMVIASVILGLVGLAGTLVFVTVVAGLLMQAPGSLA